MTTSTTSPDSRDRTVIDGLVVAAVIIGIAGALVVGRHAVDGDRADAAESTTAVTTPTTLAPVGTSLWAQPVLGPTGLPTELNVTISRHGRDLLGAIVSLAGAPCEVGVSVAAGQQKDVTCPLPTPTDAGMPASVTVRVTDQRGTDERLVVPLTVGATS